MKIVKILYNVRMRKFRKLANKATCVIIPLAITACIVILLSNKNEKVRDDKWSLNRTVHELQSNHFLSSMSHLLAEPDQTASVKGMQAVTDYCNSPATLTSGEEGLLPSGFKLRMVHIFIRHGDRTSMHTLPGFMPANVSCKFSTWYTGNDKHLKEFTFRMDKMSGKQKGRNNFSSRALYPDKNICTGSMLTSRGAFQHLQLGQYLKNVYIRGNSIFSSEMPKHSQLKVTSTHTTRTYQSAIAFSYGFLDDFSISNVESSADVHFCSRRNLGNKDCRCSNAQALYLKAESYIARFRSENLENYRKIFNKLNIENSQTLWHAVDSMLPTFCHNMSLFCSSANSSSCVTADVMGTAWDLLTAQELSHRNDPDFNILKYSTIVMAPVLTEISHRIQELTIGLQTPKFILYSGHDVTLTPLLHVLGLHDGRWPPYASRLIVELLQNKYVTEKKFYLRFLYNGVDKTSHVLFCKNHLHHGLCPLKHFSEFILSKMLSRFGFQNYYDACSRK